MGCGESRQVPAAERARPAVADNASVEGGGAGGHALVFHQSGGSRGRGPDVTRVCNQLTARGLKVHAMADLAADDVRWQLKQYAKKNHSGYQLLLVLVLAPGGQDGKLHMSGGSQIDTSEFWQPFIDCSSLRGKPKIFIFHQTDTKQVVAPVRTKGRGQVGVESDLSTSEVLPHEVDFLLAFSSEQGPTGLGSVFEDALCSELGGRDSDVLGVLTRVHGRLVHRGGAGRAPLIVSFLHCRTGLPNLVRTLNGHLQGGLPVQNGLDESWPAVRDSCEPVRPPSDEPIYEDIELVLGASLTSTNLASAGLVEDDWYGRGTGGRALVFYAEEHRAWARKLKGSLKRLGLAPQLVQIQGGNMVPLLAQVAEDAGSSRLGCVLVAVLGSLLELGGGGWGGGHGLQVGEHVFPLSHVWRPFTASRCRGLAGRPKLFFFLDPCGQISDVTRIGHPTVQRDVVNPTEDVSELADFLFVYGFSPGFLEALFRGLGAEADEEVLSAVTRAMGHSGEPSSLASFSRLSHLRSSLRGPLVLSRGSSTLEEQLSETASTVTRKECEDEALVSRPPPVQWLPREPFNLHHRGPEQVTIRTHLLDGVRTHLVDVAVTGPAGVGKTELALKCVTDSQALFEHVVWVKAGQQSSIHTTFRNLAKTLGLLSEDQENHTNINLLVEKVYATLSSQKCLFVFDNVTDYEVVQKFLPFSRGIDRTSLFFMVTSEHKRWRCNLQVSLECFTETEAEEFLIDNIGFIIEGKALLLAKMLGYHPLALQIAVSYIKFQNRSLIVKGKNFYVDQLITKYGLTQKSIMELEESSVDGYIKMELNRPLVIIWFIAIESVCSRIEGKLAIKLLDMIAFMESDDVPLSIFRSLSSQVGEDDFEGALRLLADHSLVKLHEDTVCAHRMVQDVTRKYVIKKSLILDELLSMIKNNMVTESFINSYIQHLIKIWKFTSKHKDLVIKYIHVFIAVIKNEILSRESRISLLEQHMATLKTFLGWGSADFLTIRCEYVELLWLCDLCDKVVLESDKTMAQLSAEARRSRAALRLLYTKGRGLHRLGRMQEAWLLYAGLLTARTETLGAHDPDTTRTMAGMCSTAAELEARGEPEPLELCVDLLQKEALDPEGDMEKVLIRLAGIAWRLSWDFRWSAGLALFDRVHGSLVGAEGPSHPRALLCLASKAELAFYMGREEEAWLLVHTVRCVLGHEPGERPPARRQLGAAIRTTLQTLRLQTSPSLVTAL